MMSHLPSRLAGMALVVLVIALWDPVSGTVAMRVGLPLIVAIGAALMVRNIAAVAFAAALLAGIHSQPGGEDPVTAIAWPIACVAAIATLAVIWGRRFRERIKATHGARWRNRSQDRGSSDNG
ncbi:MAG TPA: hypothetical protein DCR65_03615 [Gammaproteobacteria bacterium]|mgnify:CR=1 FL=1|jgi:hypothetical protein|nr:hypothetical protein [Gammaproteobacteria bacterium]